MKNIFTFLIALTATFVVGQTTLIDFESATTWGDFDGGAVTTIANPYNNTDNNSANVGKMVKSAGKTWGGSSTVLGSAIDFANNNTFSMKVYSPRANAKVLFKVENSSNAGINFEKEVTMTTANAWETLVFDYSAIDNTKSYHKIVLIFDNGTMGDGTANFTFYVDDIVLYQKSETCSDGVLNNGETAIDCGGPNCSPCITPPTTAAPTPPARAAADVISLYSDAYTDVASNFDAGWCGNNSVTEVMVGGNAAQKYLGNACQGIVLSNAIDASGFTHYHVDIFIAAGTDLTGKVFNLKFVGTPTTTVFKEVNHDLNALQPSVGQWVSLTGTVDLSTMGGFKEFGITSNLNDKVWYDNLYVHKNTVLGIGHIDTPSFSIYPNPMGSQLTVEGISEVQHVSIFDLTGREVLRATPNKAVFTLDTADLQSGVYMLSLQVGDSEITKKLVK